MNEESLFAPQVKIEKPEQFAAALTEKFKDAGPFSANVFSVNPGGRKFAKVMQRASDGKHGSVHCFVEKATGHVYKAAGINAPAKGVRYTSMDAALAAADLYGGYLYR